MSRHGIPLPESRAPFASLHEGSRGRLFEEPSSTARSEFQRDRDRIIHSTAFRRLQHKTQVFVYNVSDHYRTRLTHTIEVAQIARSATRALNLDEDLSEALALAHDLGHPPFGHAGEEALNRELSDHGGFDHNVQTLRIVTQLERRYAQFDGLNLTREVIEGIAKHNGPLSGPYGPGKAIPEAVHKIVDKYNIESDRFAGAEAQIASLADDIAYINHDIDDGVRANLFPLEALAELKLVGPVLRKVIDRHPKIEPNRLIHETIRRLINSMILDLVNETQNRVQQYKPTCAADVSSMSVPLASFSEDMTNQIRSLRKFLFQNMYRHNQVTHRSEAGALIVSDLYHFYSNQPDKLPINWSPILGESKNRSVRRIADFIAGMTDRFAERQHELLLND